MAALAVVVSTICASSRHTRHQRSLVSGVGSTCSAQCSCQTVRCHKNVNSEITNSASSRHRHQGECDSASWQMSYTTSQLPVLF